MSKYTGPMVDTLDMLEFLNGFYIRTVSPRMGEQAQVESTERVVAEAQRGIRKVGEESRGKTLGEVLRRIDWMRENNPEASEDWQAALEDVSVMVSDLARRAGE